MKIHIIGGSGSGKSYLANKLSQKYKITHYDLDDLQWDNESDTYGVKRPLEEKKQMLQSILDSESWIIEGVYFQWVQDAFEDADIIYVLNLPLYITKFRIIKRFIKRKFKLERGKKETLKSLFDLLKWTEYYKQSNMVKIEELLSGYSNKVSYITNKNQLKI